MKPYVLLVLALLSASPAAAQSRHLPPGDPTPPQPAVSPLSTPGSNSLAYWANGSNGVLTSVPSGFFTNVASCGAVGDDSTDDTAAIQRCIDQMPVSGGVLLFPPGLTFKTTATLTIGSGSASAVSTTNGIFLVGMVNPTGIRLGSVSNSVPGLTTIDYQGSGVAVQVNGPLFGYGLQNMHINCSSSGGTTAIKVLSGANADNANLSWSGCQTGIFSTVVAALPSVLVNDDSIHGSWRNLTGLVPDVSGAIGIELTGNSTNNSDYQTFENVLLYMGSANPNTGVLLQASDTNSLRNFHIVAAAKTSCVVLDYSVNAGWPAANLLDHFDCGGNGGTYFSNVGSPSGATPNYLTNLGQTNGTPYPILANLIDDHPPTVTVSALPICTAAVAAFGQTFVVKDASSPIYGGSLTGGGTTYAGAICNGSVWVAH